MTICNYYMDIAMIVRADIEVSMTKTIYIEEPCEAKVSGTVLKTSLAGDC
jgi:hypothetical protein